MENLTRYLAMDCEEVFSVCAVGKRATMIDCCANATPILTSDYGQCYALLPPETSSNRTAPFRQQKPGQRHGFNAYILTHSEQHTQHVINNHDPVSVITASQVSK